MSAAVELVKCRECEELAQEGDTYVTYHGDYVCGDCFDDYYTECECGEVIHQDDAEEVEGEPVCPYCLDHDVVTCDDCDKLIFEANAYTDDHRHLCDNCRMEHYVMCDYCENFTHVDDVYIDRYDDHYCGDCREYAEDNNVILMWNDNPPTEFFGNANYLEPYLGVEIEAERKESTFLSHDEVAENLEQDEVYFKEDGSLANGFELVTHPCTIEHHMDNMRWEGLAKKWAAMGYRSHDTRTCGLHIHLSRDAFGETQDERDKNIMKLIYLVETHWDEIVTFSRRTATSMNRWAASYIQDDVICPTELTDTDKVISRARGAGRYYAVNIENSHTVELRMFRGTLNTDTIKATIQFAYALHKAVMHFNIVEIQNLTWKELVIFMVGTNPYSELGEYIKRRGLLEDEQLESSIQKLSTSQNPIPYIN